MDESLIPETTFLIDLEREAGRDGTGPAHRLVTRNEAHFRRVPELRMIGYGD